MSGLTVLVVGAGALGNEVIKTLALMGAGTIWILDRDIIEPSNLTRSVLYCIPDISRHFESKTPKADLAAERVREINPDVRAIPWKGEVADFGLGRIRRVDLVFSCLDNEMARLELSWACNRLDKPLVDGGLGLMNYSSGLISLFPGGNGPCYACRKGAERRRQLLQELYGREDPCWVKERAQQEGNIVSTTPIMASVVGAVQVEMGLRYLFEDGGDKQEELASKGRACRISLHPRPGLDIFTFERSPGCSLHEPESRVTEVRELSQARSGRFSPKDLLEVAGNGLERTALILDWPMTARAQCRDCGKVFEPLVRRARFRNSPCPHCGSLDVAEIEVLDQLTVESKWASRSLVDLGLPSGHIYGVSVGGEPEVQRLHLELTGDLGADD